MALLRIGWIFWFVINCKAFIFIVLNGYFGGLDVLKWHILQIGSNYC